MALASSGIFVFRAPARHGYELDGVAIERGGATSLAVNLIKVTKLATDDVAYQGYLYSFPNVDHDYTVHISSSHTHATLSAHLGSFGSISLRFAGTKPFPHSALTCPAAKADKLKVDKSAHIGTATGSLHFHSSTGYFGTVSDKHLQAGLGSEAAYLQSGDPLSCFGIPANSLPSAVLWLYPTGFAPTESELPPFNNVLLALHWGRFTGLGVTDDEWGVPGSNPLGIPPTFGFAGPYTARMMGIDQYTRSGSSKLFTHSSGLTSAHITSTWAPLRGSVGFSKTTCEQNKGSADVSNGTVTGSLVAKFNVGGNESFGGAGAPALLNKDVGC